MNERPTSRETFHVCAGICRVNPRTNLCAGCGRPWDIPRLDESPRVPGTGQSLP
ncbi:DUF1289 domain-containing protein, partial [Citrobacter sp. AAK_AS5]